MFYDPEMSFLLPYDTVVFGRFNGVQLLCNDRQNFDINTVKFIKAKPRAGLSQTREKLAHHLLKHKIFAARRVTYTSYNEKS